MKINLKEIRIKLGLSQKEFAEKLDVTQTLISKIEAGKSKPTLKMLNNIADTFNINLVYILFGEGEMYKTDAVAVDGAGDPQVPYTPKNNNPSTSDDKWLEIIDKLVNAIEAKEIQAGKMVDTIQYLSKALADKQQTK